MLEVEPVSQIYGGKAENDNLLEQARKLSP